LHFVNSNSEEEPFLKECLGSCELYSYIDILSILEVCSSRGRSSRSHWKYCKSWN